MVPLECPGHSNSPKYLSLMIMDHPFYNSKNIIFRSHSGLIQVSFRSDSGLIQVWRIVIDTKGLVQVLQVLNSLCILPFKR